LRLSSLARRLLNVSPWRDGQSAEQRTAEDIMKINRVLVVAAALTAGSAAMMGCSTQGNDNASVSSETVQAVASNDTVGAVANKDGFEQDARWGFRRGERGDRDHRGWGFRRGERDHRGWGERRDGRRAWWRFW
jgi:hypothetical protein